MYVDWLSSSNPSHIIKVIPSSHNYSGTLGKANAWLQLIDLVLHIGTCPGRRGHFHGLCCGGSLCHMIGSWPLVGGVLTFPSCFCTPLVSRGPASVFLLLLVFFICSANVTYDCYLLPHVTFSGKRVKNLSCLKRSNHTHLFVMMINSDLKKTVTGSPSWWVRTHWREGHSHLWASFLGFKWGINFNKLLRQIKWEYAKILSHKR